MGHWRFPYGTIPPIVVALFCWCWESIITVSNSTHAAKAECLFVHSHIYAISLGRPTAILCLLLMGAFLPGLGPADASGASFSVPYTTQNTGRDLFTCRRLEPTAPHRIDDLGRSPDRLASPPAVASRVLE
jgi:hypothetical protein